MGNSQPPYASIVPIFRYLYNFEHIEKIYVKKIGNKNKNFRRSSTLRPNERQIPCDPQPLPEQPVIDSGVDVGNSAETIVPNPTSESTNENSPPPVQTSRYGRPIRPPKRLDL